MEITTQDIKHLADLSNFSLTDTEMTNLKGDLDNIIKYVSTLGELDTEGVEPTYQVFEMENIWRSDDIAEQSATRDDLLALTTESKLNQIKVPKVL